MEADKSIRDKGCLQEIMSETLSILAHSNVEKAIPIAFEYLCNKLNLTRAFVTKTSDTPSIFDVAFLYETEPLLADRPTSYDYSDWLELASFSHNNKRLVVKDIDDYNKDSATYKYFSFAGAKSLVSCLLANESDFIGSTIFIDSHNVREWTDIELDILEDISMLLFPVILISKRSELKEQMYMDARKAVDEANKVRNLFLSNMSHEIRTPLNSILGMVTIMRHNADNKDVIEQGIERIEKSSKQLMGFVSMCLDMTMLNNGEMQLSDEWFGMDAFIKEVDSLIAPFLQNKYQKCIISNEASNLTVYGDKKKLCGILMNILTNAMKYSAENDDIFMSIKSEYQDDNKTIIHFSIRDSGNGITDEIMKNIYDPFSNAISEQSDEHGTGLGIPLTKGMVDLMHGSMDIYSTVGKGTEVLIDIPFVVSNDKSGETEIINKADEDTARFEEMYLGRRILIAEDNALMADILATILGYRGLETDHAANGQEALDMYISRPPFYYDLILMDIQMPIMDGLEATRAIRSQNRADSSIIPIAALSASAFNEDINKSIEAGMNEHLSKPVGERELFDAISRLVL